MTDAGDVTVVALVVVGRLLLPLLIFRFPLPGILACLVLDALDQTLFQAYTDLDLSGYQSYDKALDVYYLGLAYIATMRNWTHAWAFRIARFLFYYRLVGVVAFELNAGDDRTLLLLFPNTFEFFFIFYEAVRLRWDPARQSDRFWFGAAAFIWIVVKVPQEWWIHVAQLDATDEMAAHPQVTVAIFAALAIALIVARAVLAPRVRPPDHPWRVMSTALHGPLGSSRLRIEYRLHREGVGDLRRIEQIWLVSLLWIVFVQFLPVDATVLDVIISVTVLVVVDGAISAFSARRHQDVGNAGLAFLARSAVNVGLLFVLRELVPVRDFPEQIALFLVLLATLVLTLYERYRPVYEARPFATKPRAAALTRRQGARPA